MSNQQPGQQPTNPRGPHHRPPPPSSGTPQPQSSQSTQFSQQHPTLTTRRSHLSPNFARKLQQLALPLAPLVQLTSGTVHPEFPQTLLNFWLLTDDQLDRLASFYHQRTPCQWTAHYPCPVAWPAGMEIEEKRRRIGRFIGLRGCESPLPSAASLRTMGLDLNMRETGTGLKEKDDDDDDDDVEIDTDVEMGGQQEQRRQQRSFSKVASSPTMAMGNEGTNMSAYISDLLKPTMGTTEEDITETERKIRRAEDELDEIKRKMGWYL
ncbi:hypothetical protein QBC32DRAFT_407697 [Pseudoneurospora amorphoporcata]|uniref:Uncharacterized protein n=1 Tax=Pseudoneurospora amorphoporcata TaxID=241081 RepID=A0AAN6SDM0_9PEZI|nr:hypothetical protein QBC32DRAFT_407697 [Pseudoneurospora amorphoporcata]